jgi:hypothetical protein
MARRPKPIVSVPDKSPAPTVQVSGLLQTSLANLLGSLGLLAQNPATTTPTIHGSGTKHFVIAASGSHQWKPEGDRILRKIISDTAQWALTMNGMTYTNIAALGAPSVLNEGILIYSNVAVQDSMSIFIKADTMLTMSVSASGTQRITLHWDYVN